MRGHRPGSTIPESIASDGGPAMVDLGLTTPWRRTAVFPEYRDRSQLDVFRELAIACADRTAVRDGERSLSYLQLHESIEAVAGAVHDWRPSGRTDSGDRPWTVTAVVGHGIEALLTVYGVMAAGAVLVPIDAAEPVEQDHAHPSRGWCGARGQHCRPCRPHPSGGWLSRAAPRGPPRPRDAGACDRRPTRAPTLGPWRWSTSRRAPPVRRRGSSATT